MPALMDDGIGKALEGKTSVSEILRAVGRADAGVFAE
jgi:hypothetical protein